jgi:hypothetical protein
MNAVDQIKVPFGNSPSDYSTCLSTFTILSSYRMLTPTITKTDEDDAQDRLAFDEQVGWDILALS